MVKRKLYFLLLFASILLFLMGFVKNHETFDINVYDTYFVIAQNHLYWLFSQLLLFFFMIYLTLEKVKLQLFKELNLIHIFGTLIFVSGIFFPYYLLHQSSNSLLGYDYERLNVYRSFCVLFFLIVQFLFIINIFASIIKKLCNSATK